MITTLENAPAESIRLGKGNGTIHVYRDSQYLRITPAVRGLENYLFAVEHKPVNDRKHGIRVQKQVLPLLWPQTDQRGMPFTQCFAGLEPMVVELLEAQGFTVIQAGGRPASMEAPMLERLADFDDTDPLALKWVQLHECGLIRYDAMHVERAKIIAQIVRAWPKAKIIIVATRISDARHLQQQLSEYHGKVRLFSGQHHPAQGTRVVIATYNTLGNGAIEVEKRNIYIAVDPHELFATTMDVGIEGIKHLRCARVYGLLADNVAVAPYQRSLMTAFFGLDSVHIPRHGYHDLPVDVLFTRIFGGRRPPITKDDLVVKRLGIWQHYLRNRRIAGLFTALVCKDTLALLTNYADIEAHFRWRLRGRKGLLVENVEHGLILAKLLPDVPFIAGADVWTKGLSPQQLKILKPHNNKKRKAKNCAIVTHTGLAETERFDVLVRADGGTGILALPEAYGAVSNDDEAKRLLLVDFQDQHHPLLRQWRRQRRDAYIRSQWNFLGQDPPKYMDRFVAERPRVQ